MTKMQIGNQERERETSEQIMISASQMVKLRVEKENLIILSDRTYMRVP